jgi:diguanylate cyclase (GGDEF)-like protein
MNIDVRTMMLVMAAINLLFAGLLALVGMHAGTIKGARQWALAELCFGIGFGLTSTLTAMPQPAMVGLIAALLALGTGLRFNGIEAFKGQPVRYSIPAALIALLATQSIWFSVVNDNPAGRIVANWLVLGLANAACAAALCVRVAQPLRTAYWLAGASFVVMSFSMLMRAAFAYLQPPESLLLFSPSNVNPTVFLIANLAQTSLSCSLVLMINYRLADDLLALAATDSLTGLRNRRSLIQSAVRLSAYARRSGRPLAILVIDVDHFKLINDQHGHPAGDEVLRSLAGLMQSMIRSEDYLARIGGEEFCIVLPSTSEAAAAVLAERIRSEFAQLQVPWAGQTLHGTISIGVADSLSAGADLAGLMVAGDNTLYRAKHDGRNRVALFSAASAHDQHQGSMSA